MLVQNGRSRVAANCSNSSINAAGFFSLFYRWSTIECSGSSRNPPRFLSTQTTSRTTPRPFALPPPMGNQKHHRYTSTSTLPSTEPPLSTSLRQIMRTLPHSVVVLTTSLPRPSPDLEGILAAQKSGIPYDPKAPQRNNYRAMTISSFTTLTLTPKPIVTFNIRTPSITLNALGKAGHFYIHVLEGSEEGRGVADRFTKGGGGVDGFEGLDVCEEKFGDGEVVIPRIVGRGVRRVLRCRVLGKGEGGGDVGFVKVGDHVLVLAEVREVVGADGEGGDWLGLCYADGEYRAVGEVIDGASKKVVDDALPQGCIV
ncbi:hypothetical protein HYFRA_00002820 [Hymenoscyphus fraxineus]|uniref:Flavin reductase like domain-containing protein n=1 Tax=Hymenoscyphus fraxineus TaxID=746836 RepID=A0A9N9KP93_9HELO|nr:hypothetical protein HYFRA_00002820 [Hymenoscyphus fraxineus]